MSPIDEVALASRAAVLRQIVENAIHVATDPGARDYLQRGLLTHLELVERYLRNAQRRSKASAQLRMWAAERALSSIEGFVTRDNTLRHIGAPIGAAVVD